jgi:hypothetical protein
MEGLLLSKKDAERIEAALRWIERHKNDQTPQRARPIIGGGGGGTTGGIDLKIYKIKSNAEGDEVYNCIEEILDATEWDDIAGDPKFDDKETYEEVSDEVTAQVNGYKKSRFICEYLIGSGENYFVGWSILWTAGNNSGQTKAITAYNDTTGQFTLNSDCTSDIEISDPFTVRSETVEILNLAGFDPVAGQHNLAVGDMLAAWSIDDDESNSRLVGLPCAGGGGSGIRKAFVKTTPGAVKTVTCYLDIDVTGTEITVNCSIAGAGTALNSAAPRIVDGDLIFVCQISEDWYCTTVFDRDELCVCTAP